MQRKRRPSKSRGSGAQTIIFLIVTFLVERQLRRRPVATLHIIVIKQSKGGLTTLARQCLNGWGGPLSAAVAPATPGANSIAKPDTNSGAGRMTEVSYDIGSISDTF